MDIPELPKEHWPAKGDIEMQAARGRDILQRRHAGQTLIEIGKAHGISGDRVRQLLEQYRERYQRAGIDIPPGK